MTSAAVANGAAHAKLKITKIMCHMHAKKLERCKPKTFYAAPISIEKRLKLIKTAIYRLKIEK